jgi:hypothetical protein
VARNTSDIDGLEGDAAKDRSTDAWIKEIGVFTAVVSLIVATAVGYASVRLSEEANEIQVSLSGIAQAQRDIADIAEKRTSSNELSDTIRDFAKLDSSDTRNQNIFR